MAGLEVACTFSGAEDGSACSPTTAEVGVEEVESLQASSLTEDLDDFGTAVLEAKGKGPPAKTAGGVPPAGRQGSNPPAPHGLPYCFTWPVRQGLPGVFPLPVGASNFDGSAIDFTIVSDSV